MSVSIDSMPGEKPHVVIKEGAISHIKEYLANTHGAERILLCHSKTLFLKNEYARSFLSDINSLLTCETYMVTGEPSPFMVENAASIIKKTGCQAVVGIGGGSVMDLAKAASAAFFMEHPVKEYLEGIGSLKPDGRRLPLVLVPSTAGTGSEATHNAVLSEPGEYGYKKSLRHPDYAADLAVIDPLLFISVPRHTAFFSGMDAISQLVEAYLSTASDSVSEEYSVRGLELAGQAFEHIITGTSNISIWTKMAEAAYYSGLALSRAGLGLVHGLAGPVGARLPIPHGEACARLIMPVLYRTIKKSEKNKDFIILDKLKKITSLLSCGYRSSPDELIKILDAFFDKAQVTFSPIRIKTDDIDYILNIYSHKNHPCTFTSQEVREILKEGLC
ncbi:iron-containing alcohol dehydrogenase [Spirochaetia bacterium 38H-sp]|uniref:Iron-containing alcohol dehydrogenase n=1 Tax=Rarispira pelagica TaxID=3141764 RepID=A0ABU9UBZ7_9SPIR